MGTRPTIMSTPANKLAEFASALGVSREDSRAILGASAEQLDDPEHRVDLERFYDLLEALVERARLPEHFGLDAVAEWEVESFDVLGYLVYTSATVGQALQRFIDFRVLWSDGESFWLEDDDEQVRVVWRGYGRRRPAHDYVCDMVAADLILGTQRLIGQALDVTSIQFCYPEPEDTSAWARVFSPAVLRFGAPTLQITLSRASLELPIPSADALLASYFEGLVSARARLLDQSSSASARLRAALLEQLPGAGAPSVDDYAALLGASPRSLQRWLASEQTSFRGVVDEVRCELAMRHLERGASIGEVTWLVGFSEPRAFLRAFKRWTGQTPTSWRAAR